MGHISQVNQVPQQPRDSPPYPSSSEECTDGSIHPCDVIGKGVITFEEANALLSDYRVMMPCFPFVMISNTATIQTLRCDRPFLLLAILVAASYRNFPLQRALEEVVKSYIGDYVIHGQNGTYPQPLETLQGLLVILSGYVLLICY